MCLILAFCLSENSRFSETVEQGPSSTTVFEVWTDDRAADGSSDEPVIQPWYKARHAGRKIFMIELHRGTMAAFNGVATTFGFDIDYINWSGRQAANKTSFLKALNETWEWEEEVRTEWNWVNITNSLTLFPNPHKIRKNFLRRFGQKLYTYDIVACSMPAALCELFLPFDLPILIWLSVPLEFL